MSNHSLGKHFCAKVFTCLRGLQHFMTKTMADGPGSYLGDALSIQFMSATQALLVSLWSSLEISKASSAQCELLAPRFAPCLVACTQMHASELCVVGCKISLKSKPNCSWICIYIWEWKVASIQNCRCRPRQNCHSFCIAFIRISFKMICSFLRPYHIELSLVKSRHEVVCP